jgi:hypothetical protein
MDTNSFKKEVKEDVTENVTKEVEQTLEPVNNAKVERLDKKVLSKDEEIKKLKAQLAEAQKVNKLKKGDIRAEVNRQGDVKLIKIGLDSFGKPIWKKANKLTDADVKRREQYMQDIKQLNAKKY